MRSNALVFFLALAACAPKTVPLEPAAKAAPVVEVEPGPEVAYAAGLTDARSPLPSEVVDDLLVLEEGTEGLQWKDGDLLVYTLTSSSYFPDPPYTPGYVFPLFGESWFTSGTQVYDACAGLEGEELDLRLEQLLGMPPGGDHDVFLAVWIDPADLFRPCANADVTATSCPVAAPLVPGGGDSVSWDCTNPEVPLTEHQAWLCLKWTDSYGPSEVLSRYPWTALGYTFDWGQLDDPEGPSEFVANGGTQVELEAVVGVEEFCRE